MIGRFFRMILGLLLLGIVLFIGTGMWVVSDGVTDVGLHADVALVAGHGRLLDGLPGPILKARLDRAAQLFQQEAFAHIVVSGSAGAGGEDEAAVMAQYLQNQDIPATAIIQDNQGTSLEATARNLSGIMRDQDYNSVMVITDYYLMTRTKMALRSAGIIVIEHAHTGKLQQADVTLIAQEVVTLYQIWYNQYLRTSVDQAWKEAQVGYAQSGKYLQATKDKISGWIDHLAK